MFAVGALSCAVQVIWGMLSAMLDQQTVDKVQMLRGAAMDVYFEAHLTTAQAEFMKEVLSMPAAPGSLPESTRELMQGGDTTRACGISGPAAWKNGRHARGPASNHLHEVLHP